MEYRIVIEVFGLPDEDTAQKRLDELMDLAAELDKDQQETFIFGKIGKMEE